MKKVLCPLGCALLVAVLALAACGGSGSTASSSPSAAPSQGGGVAFGDAERDRDPAADTDRGRDHRLHDARRIQRQRHLRREHRRHGPQDPGRRRGLQASPCWSPDGKQIVYDEGAPGPKGLSQVWVMNADGSGKTQLTKGSLGYRNFMPSWSPDGKRIVFTSLVFYTDGVERDAIYVMNADGSGLRNVTSKKGPGVTSADYWPTWEKDGTITFYRNTRGGGLSKFSVNPDGSGLTRLVKEAGTSTYQQQDWWLKYEYGLSPDGKWVARHDVKTDRLVVARVRGGGAPVTLLDPVAAYAQDSVAVAWSPDGKALAIAGQSETSFERLYIVNADGTGLSAVPGVDSAKEPAWRP